MSPEAARHLVLIGLMGAGKTTVGAACAERLERSFVDTDELVVALTGRTVGEIFADGGEPAFRDAERQAVADACASPNPLVIACGGGAVLDSENRRRLRAAGLVVWLRADAHELASRVRDQGIDRPLLASRDPESELTRLGALREGAYESTAHVAVDTGGRTVGEVADAVMQEFQRCAA